MQQLNIKNLKANCIIGINQDEKDRRQGIVINVTMWADLSKAMRSDKIADTVDYNTISEKISTFAEGSRFNLIEALAYGIAKICLNEELIRKIRVKIDKLEALKFAESAGVAIVMHK